MAEGHKNLLKKGTVPIEHSTMIDIEIIHFDGTEDIFPIIICSNFSFRSTYEIFFDNVYIHLTPL